MDVTAIVMPVAGHGGLNGNYWSANPNNAKTSYYLHFTQTQVAPKYTQECRAYGYSVRPVRETP